MRFELSEASNIMDFSKRVNIRDLSDLEKLQEKFGGYSLIINFRKKTIEIYDDYRE